MGNGGKDNNDKDKDKDKPKERQKCSRCDGKGTIIGYKGDVVLGEVPCPRCGGSGFEPDN